MTTASLCRFTMHLHYPLSLAEIKLGHSWGFGVGFLLYVQQGSAEQNKEPGIFLCTLIYHVCSGNLMHSGNTGLTRCEQCSCAEHSQHHIRPIPNLHWSKNSMKLWSFTFSKHPETFWKIKINIKILLLHRCSEKGESEPCSSAVHLLRERTARDKTLLTHTKDNHHKFNPPSSTPQPRSWEL